MKYLCYLLAGAFGYGAFEACFRAFKSYQEHPGTRGMTELAAGIGAAAFMLILMVMIFNAAREKPSQQTPIDSSVAQGNDKGNKDEQSTE